METYFQNELVWLTQQKISGLFAANQSNISKHFKNIFESGELNKGVTVQLKEVVKWLET